MSPEEGVARLLFHAQPNEGSFLDMLRPYRGLRHDVLEDVMAALKASASVVASETSPRTVVSALWAISYFGRL